MPMKSKAQRRALWAKDPKLAREFENKTSKNAKLPEKKNSSGKKKTAGKRKGGK